MKVSFIIPAWNEAKGIAETLKQFAALRRFDYEVVVSDNGSTDDTVALARQQGATVVIRPSDIKTSIGECRNRGAKAARGDLLWFMDADVRIHDIESTVEEVLHYFSTHEHCAAATLQLSIYPAEATWADRLVFTAFNASVWFQNRVTKSGASPGDTMIIRKTDFDRAHGFRPELRTAEDFELFHRLAKVGDIMYFWHRFISMSPRRIHRDGWLKVLSQWFNNWFTQVILKKVNTTDWEARR